MIFIADVGLPAGARRGLAAYQAGVNRRQTYEDQVADAKAAFKRHNNKRNATFRVVRSTLTVMCAGARRCCYCEDSVADEIDHIMPKDLYPERTFIWENYIYACG